MTWIYDISFSSSMVDIPTYIKKLIDETNVGYQNRQDPFNVLQKITLNHFSVCVCFKCLFKIKPTPMPNIL